MTYFFPPDECRGRLSNISIENGPNIGDIVAVTNYGGVYPSHYTAFKYFWGDTHDSFHNKDGKQIEDYVCGTFLLYNNIWKVCGCVVHNWSLNVLVYLKDRLNRKMVVRADCVKVIRKKDSEVKSINIERLSCR